jgi:serine/threonine-protein kinase
MNPQLQRLQAALAGRYEVEHELGRGGMAVVYLGRDLRLARRVAIKVFEQEGGHGQASERFLREIRVAAQLQHPNILPVHDSGEADGLVYYVMPYVAGASLRERLEREGPLPVADAVRIAREVAEALDHAHREGIVHRDIKPDNIMLASGVAVVADFGIARAIEEAGAGKLTDTGMAIGTPTYMSPEQATASPNVDGRADIYALGCVLYEMLAGSPPFSGPTAQAVMARHTADQVPPISTVRDVPPGLEAAVVKALAKLPADRWTTGRAFAEALNASTTGSPERIPGRRGVRRLAFAGAAIVAALLWASRASLVRALAGAPAAARSVAVLPFVVVGDSTQAHVGFGIATAVVTALVKVDSLRVPNLSSEPARPVTDPREIGRALNVATVLTGSVQITGQRLRIEPRLIRVSDGVVVWAELYDGSMQDIFAVQDSIAEMIVRALQIELTPATRASVARGVRTRDAQAYDLLLRAGLALASVRTDSVVSAIRLYQQSLARDSLYADAWVGLAYAYSLYYQVAGVAPAEVAIQWRRAAERAIELDSLSADGYALLGTLRSQYDWDWDRAWRDLRRAVTLAPGASGARLLYAQFLNIVGQHDSALVQMRQAVANDPTSAFLQANLAVRFWISGLPDSAIAAGQHALQLDSTNWVASAVLAEVYELRGMRAAARHEADRVLRFAGDSLPLALALLAGYYGPAGHREQAQEMLNRLEALARRQYVPPTYLGRARAALGDRAGALTALEQSARLHDLDLSWDLISGSYVLLDGDPRYEAVRRTVFGTRIVPRRIGSRP